MEQSWTPNDKIKKKIVFSLAGAEAFVLLLLVSNFLKVYSGLTSLILSLVVVLASILFDVFIWNKVSTEYIAVDETGIEWTGYRSNWEWVDQIHVRKEKEKPMFLIIKEGTFYHKIPLRLYEGQVQSIIQQIQKLGLQVTE